MFELATPLALLLLPLPWLAARLLPPAQARGAALAVPDRIGAALLTAGGRSGSATLERAQRLLPWAAWALFVVALSGPRTLEPVPALRVSGRDLAIALDLSGSMVRDDFYLDGQPITRLEAVTTVGAEFARRRAGDRVALIVFGSEAYYAAPFTFDTEAVIEAMESFKDEPFLIGTRTFTPQLHHQNYAPYLIIETTDGKPHVAAEFTISEPVPMDVLFGKRYEYIAR